MPRAAHRIAACRKRRQRGTISCCSRIGTTCFAHRVCMLIIFLRNLPTLICVNTNSSTVTPSAAIPLRFVDADFSM